MTFQTLCESFLLYFIRASGLLFLPACLLQNGVYLSFFVFDIIFAPFLVHLIYKPIYLLFIKNLQMEIFNYFFFT